MLDKRDTALLGCRTGGLQGPEGSRTGRMQDRTGDMQDSKNAGQEGCWIEGIQDRYDARK